MEIRKEFGLDIWLDEVEDILKGFELPLNTFYESKRGLLDLEPLSNELQNVLMLDVPIEQRIFFTHFFKMSIAYLEACCNEGDKIFKHIVLLATTVFSPDGDKSTFDRMIENQRTSRRNKTEEKFFQICIEERDAFVLTAPTQFNAEQFKSIIKKTVEIFLYNKGCWLSLKQFQESGLADLVDYLKQRLSSKYLSLMGDLNEE